MPTKTRKLSNNASQTGLAERRNKPTSTVGRGKSIQLSGVPKQKRYSTQGINLYFGDSTEYYGKWKTPTVIVSDGGYGVLGFEGDTSDHLGLPEWYEPHIIQWAKYATPQTTLWFWNSEIGWAAVHPILEKHGWRYQNCNIWNKTKAHIAGNVNTKKIRRFPVVTEVCVQYTFEAKADGLPLKQWLLSEWKRTGLSLKQANAACGVKDAAVRKYLDQGHLWYFPPPDMFLKLQEHANRYGSQSGRPYFSLDGLKPASGEQWALMRSKFYCPHGWTNVWERNPVSGAERVKVGNKAVHLNQKPLDLMTMIISASSDKGDIVWEPFGGLFTASLAAKHLERKSYAAEIDATYYQFGISRFSKHKSVTELC
jgi:hypothetical protein